MTDTAYRDRFFRIFQMNVERRSRSAQGEDGGSKTSATKLPLLLQGEALKAKVAENTLVLMTDALSSAEELRTAGTDVWKRNVRLNCERWYDIATAGTVDRAGYDPLYRELQAKAAKLGRHLVMNRRYRLWTPKYLSLQIPPALIDEQLCTTYARVALSLSAVRDLPPEEFAPAMVPLMAYADVMMDGEVHPWNDACSRVATALLMWIAAYGAATPPLFGSREEHYSGIQDLKAHERYLAACLVRADAEAP